MLLNILVLTFVGGFAAITVLGHVLLLEAICPGLFRRRVTSRSGTIAGEGHHHLHQPN